MQIKRYEKNLSSDCLVRIFASRTGGFALDSTQLVDTLGTWSFYGSDPFQSIEAGAGDGEADLADLRKIMEPYSNQLQWVNGDSQSVSVPFLGGAVGYISYDYGRCLERIPNLAKDDLELPYFSFGLYDRIVAKDSLSGAVYLVASEVRESAEQSFQYLEACLNVVDSMDLKNSVFSFKDWNWDTSRADFCHAVEAIKALIAKGEVYQVNLSRRRSVSFRGSALDLYRALRLGNPAPYSGFYKGRDLSLISTSPEQFLKKTGDALVTRPIKGTRPRGKNKAEDERLAEELKLSEKDRAELLMIIDLERNDLGRVAEFGSVRGDSEYRIEYYKSVMHATAEVKAILAEGRDVFDAIHALFPGGSITGAPKVKAMAAIDRLERHRRGLYCGSFGYIGFNQDAELNISIRSLLCHRDHLYYSVGSGIVWDSDANEEYAETEAKGAAIEATLKALPKADSKHD